MRRFFRNEVAVTAAVLVGLLMFKGVHAAGWLPAAVMEPADELMSTLVNRDLNKEAREALTAGYYEGLINEGSRISSMNRLLTDTRGVTWEAREQPDRRQTENFLFYELIPNSEMPDYRDDRFQYYLRTNSTGMADREYSVEKPDGIHRIALMGDSITRGQGAPFQANYEALLETALNVREGGSRHVEILNFAVGSYSVMQMLDAAITRAALYEPDVYVLALTDLSVYRSWGHHLSLLLNSDIDLEYEYLRTVVRQAGLQPNEPRGVIDAKLARFRIPTIRWAVSEVQAHARNHGAEIAVLLVPTADDPRLLREEFLGIRELLAELGVPVIDLLDTFADVDRSQHRVADRDRHPNAAGHQLLFEHLRERLVADAALMRLFTGDPIGLGR